MKRIAAILLITVFCALPYLAMGEAEPASRILVAYFSASGNTKAVAQVVADHLGADLYEITAEEPYTEADLAYYTGGRCDQEQDNPSVRPAINGTVANMDQYDLILIGHPIWHGQAPRIISTFLESYDFSGKTLVTFCTSHSSPLGSSARNLYPLVPEDVTWLNSQRFPGNVSEESVTAWLDAEIIPYEEENMKSNTLMMTVGDTTVAVDWEDNESVSALKELAVTGLAIQMSMYGGFEQVGSIGHRLPSHDVQTNTSSGDIVLYSSSQLVVFYGSNSWAYTRLGRITDKTPEEMRNLLGNGDVTITLTVD